MNSTKRALYKFGEIEELNQVSCNSTLNVDGAEGIYEVDITIGTDLGDTGFRYEAFNIPDRFQLIFDGKIVADSKYVGAQSYNNALLQVTNKVLPIFKYNGTNFINSGLTEVVTVRSSDIANGTPSEPTEGSGKLKFNKDKANVTDMKLRVFGVLGNTLWNGTPICPNTFNITQTGIISKIYFLSYYDTINEIICNNLDNITQYFSLGKLKIGTKLYLDNQLLQLAPTGYVVLGTTIYEIVLGEIIDIYPCFKTTII